ncbi:benzoate/H(+) symporter BenE family transporter [Microbacterium sp. Au-Mic1]|uniref:benzoate/H(+) symporter BenE family transporter n=1 Tax=Microbacterium sp. Au-Mic1 TaxID=2906457 RepID=UPI001E4EADD3|nr:benzoate/H(+) symporter BenE family transporter [Microbacterium sp. Au-Mic1]MCE4026923.1 benzoate/H(+) symporter BenE family transporter [Microbacterium sp. Au-Mic1]
MSETASPPSPHSGSSASRPIMAGVVTALVGFTSSFAVVLTGLAAVGATHPQAASGLLALSLTMGVACIVLAWRYRMPITAAWSTPGAALLAASGAVEGGWPAAVGAFLIVAALILLTALVPQLGSLIAAIPPSIAQAMLAGVLLPLCLAPIVGLGKNPWGVVPVILTWLVFARLAPRWAVPLAFLTATVVIVVGIVTGGPATGSGTGSGAALDPATLLPHLELTMPTFTVGALVGIALPLFIVTMASQNVPGVAVMRSFGYEVPWRPAMLVTGLGSALGAPAGGHAINLAAISAALAAAPDAEPDPKRRWIAGVSTGVSYLVLGGCSAAFAALVVLAPVAVIPAVAGLALFGAFGSAVQQAIDDPGERTPAVVTFLVAASGMAFWGVSAAFWALLAGLLVRGALHLGRR